VLITSRLFPTRPLGRWRAHKVLERDVLVYRRNWTIIVSGFFEPVFYLLGIGFGLGSLIGTVTGPDGTQIPYAVFVAPALLATAAMNGAVYDSTNMFFRLRYEKAYDGMLATPMNVGDIALGEVSWALGRGALYGLGFLVVMFVFGLVPSPWGVLALPASMLIGFATAAAGLAATTYMRSWQDLDLLFVVILPLFLFSGTFFPIDTYPEPLRTMASPRHFRRRKPALGPDGWVLSRARPKSMSSPQRHEAHEEEKGV